VINTKGEEEEGIRLTAEAPPVVEGSEAHPGISSLPWTGELIEREKARHLLFHHLKFSLVLPPPSVGKGPGCAGSEISFEEAEGQTEKEAGYELAPFWINGTKNGLKPSAMEFEGEGGRTGRLVSRDGDGYYAGKVTVDGAWEGASVLITAE
jgi:hypothetical protein